MFPRLPLTELKDLKGRPLLTYLLLLTSIFSSGHLLIFVFANDLFIRLDTLKLFLLSISITTPVFAVFIFIDSMYVLREYKKKEEDSIFLLILGGSISTSLNLYPLILVRCFFVYSAKIALIVFIILALGNFIAELWYTRRAKKKGTGRNE